MAQAIGRLLHGADPALYGWPATDFSMPVAVHSACAMTKSLTPLESRNAFFSAASMLGLAAKNAHACATVISLDESAPLGTTTPSSRRRMPESYQLSMTTFGGIDGGAHPSGGTHSSRLGALGHGPA